MDGVCFDNESVTLWILFGYHGTGEEPEASIQAHNYLSLRLNLHCRSLMSNSDLLTILEFLI